MKSGRPTRLQLAGRRERIERRALRREVDNWRVINDTIKLVIIPFFLPERGFAPSEYSPPPPTATR